MREMFEFGLVESGFSVPNVRGYCGEIGLGGGDQSEYGFISLSGSYGHDHDHE